jgi:Protein of unknown function (DUF4239)
MGLTIFISFISATIAAFAAVSTGYYLTTADFISDLGGIGVFLSAFGTLYGIMSAFVVFEVWGQYNRTVTLVDKEALMLETLYRYVLYFRDKKMISHIREAIVSYCSLIVKGNFHALATGHRNNKTGDQFRKIAEVLREITFDDDHDAIVFGKTIEHYEALADVRSERLTQSLARLPAVLKFFFYTTSLFLIGTMCVVPFTNMWYQAGTVFMLVFTITLVIQLTEDLDNPFVGVWNVTTQPFARTIERISS